MNLDFSPNQNIIRKSVAKYLSAECPYNRVKEIEETDQGYDPVMWDKMAELGWLGCVIPEEYGGTGGEFIDLIIIQEEMGKRVFPSPFFSTVVQCADIIMLSGNEDQKSELLSSIADGKLIMSLAQYEPEASYRESGIQMEALDKGDHFILSGTKMFVMDANVCQKLIVAARIPEKGITLFLVDSDSSNMVIAKIPTIGKDNTCEVSFSDVVVSKANVIGQIGGGWEILEKMNARASIAKAAEMTGGCRACLDITADYAKNRQQYGIPIGGNQAVQHYLANMLLAFDTSHSYLYEVSCMVDAQKDYATDASTLKACCNENYKFISERAIQIHGAFGTTREGDVGLFYRKAKACEYACGDTFMHYEKIADSLFS